MAKKKTKDSDYDPNEDDGALSDEEGEDGDIQTPNGIAETLVNEKKFMVFESAIRQLVNWVRCNTCNESLEVDDELPFGRVKGSMLTLKLECINGHEWVWNSQPLLGKGRDEVPAGNLLASAAMLYSGASYSKVAHMASFMNLEFISQSTMNNHQRDYLFPVVHETWYHEQHTLWDSLVGKQVKLSGDGRCDSPGYSAKYCTYVMMDMDTGKVVDLETVAVTEVGSSNAMEKEGCKRSLNRLKENNVNVTVLCTDRHASIAKMLREDHEDINHQFDLWHLAKSATKKLNAKSKKQECQELGAWLPSVRNHLWWASASCDGDKVELLEKWRSLVYHVTDQHEWGGSQKYHACGHGPLSQEDRESKKWIRVGSAAHEALSDVVNDKRLLNGVNQVNLFCHTGKTEVFNSNVLKFCPKRIHFPYEGMVVRTKLTAIETNHNTDRAQARVKRKAAHSGPVGSLRYKAVCPKAKKKWIAKPIYEKKNYDFVYDMMADVVKRKLLDQKGNSNPLFFNPPAKAVQGNIAPVVNPGKDVLIQTHVTRFGHGN